MCDETKEERQDNELAALQVSYFYYLLLNWLLYIIK